MFSSVVRELNLFGNIENKPLRKSFWIFFAIAISAYLSIMTSHYPHQDDYCRYLANYTCGYHGRFLDSFLEWILHSSSCITDTTPLTQILSCAILAYTAIIFMKILKANYKDLLCITPVVISPFIVECMLFKFDNLFMIISVFFAVIAAYVASKNTKESFLLQLICLLCALTTYQSAINIYGIIFLYKLMQETTIESTIFQAIQKMRYWFYATAIAFLIIIPIRLLTEGYGAGVGGTFFIIPNDVENLKIICSNIVRYFTELKDDWSCNTVGILTFVLLVFFVVVSIKKCYASTHSLGKTLFAMCLLTLLFIMPYGFVAFTHYADTRQFIPPRVLYGCCFVISIAFFELYKMFFNSELLRMFLRGALFLWAVWNVTFANSIGNICHRQEELCSGIMLNLAEDIYHFCPKNTKNYYLHFTNEAITPTANNFTSVYPVVNKMLIKIWLTSHLFTMSFYKADFPRLNNIPPDERWDVLIFDLKKPKLIKSSLLYDMHLYEIDEKKIVCVTFKQFKKQQKPVTVAPLDIFLIENHSFCK